MMEKDTIIQVEDTLRVIVEKEANPEATVQKDMDTVVRKAKAGVNLLKEVIIMVVDTITVTMDMATIKSQSVTSYFDVTINCSVNRNGFLSINNVFRLFLLVNVVFYF